MAVVEKSADAIAIGAGSQETRELLLCLPEFILRALATDNVEVFPSFFAQRSQRETDCDPILIVVGHVDLPQLDLFAGLIHSLVGIVSETISLPRLPLRLPGLFIDTSVCDCILINIGRFIITEAAQPTHVATIVVNSDADSRKLLFKLQKLAFVQLGILQGNDDEVTFSAHGMGGIKHFFEPA